MAGWMNGWMNEWMAGCTNGLIGFGAETAWLHSCVHLLLEGPEGLLETTDPTQSGCQQGRQCKCFSLCVRTAHELERKKIQRHFVLLFIFNFFFGGW